MADSEEIQGWLSGRIPSGWFTSAPEVTVDREEILVVGETSPPDTGEGASSEAQNAAREGRIKQFREDTRQQRMQIADEAERRFRRKVSWGARCGEASELFTHLALPMMTRLRIADRQTLDALVESGVARNRSQALAWCVRLVRQHQGDWLNELKSAMERVEQVRNEGPTVA
jgi:hypothetical protein